MTLSEKYGIPPEKIKAMIKDGWINCSVVQYEEIVTFYNSEISKGIDSPQAKHNAAAKFRISERWVHDIVKRLK
jgi:hypothetical protein